MAKKRFHERHPRILSVLGGFLFGNTVLERGLVLAPIVVASYNFECALALGLAFMAITFFTVSLSSFFSKKIPYTIRIILYTLIACAIYIPVAICTERWFPDSLLKIGVFLPLLVTNSLIVVKSESRFHRRSKGKMATELLSHCLGFFAVILLVGIIREFLGSGSFFGMSIPWAVKAPALLLPFGGFFIVGLLAALVKQIQRKLESSEKTDKTVDRKSEQTT